MVRTFRLPPLRALAVPAVLLGLTLAVQACTPTIDQRGYVPDPAQVERIKPGVDNRESITRALGTPSVRSTFNDRTWYYVSTRTESEAFFRPEVLERTILEIDFDRQGLVENVRNYTLEDGQQVALVQRTTPTRGKELTFFGQLFGNFGKFNQAASGE
ncbi:outer membrane protein assembly factor BamE [Zavarzinia sp. CC-PAN008]|uniref:outer membrane protein assembly factor BamE n=1 Tax=Zavarzinia sp. CC-PAN008 TaxID=3243332 RepID=UPI003F74582C